MGEFYKGVVTESMARSAYDMQRAAGYGFAVRRPNTQLLNTIINSPWEGRNFKQSVGWNVASVAIQAKEIIAKASLAGVSIMAMTHELAALQAVDLWKAERLIRTEANYFANQGEKIAYERCGIDRYRYMATLDKKRFVNCKFCFIDALHKKGHGMRPVEK